MAMDVYGYECHGYDDRVYIVHRSLKHIYWPISSCRQAMARMRGTRRCRRRRRRR
jgi:hypothetical protein